MVFSRIISSPEWALFDASGLCEHKSIVQTLFQIIHGTPDALVHVMIVDVLVVRIVHFGSNGVHARKGRVLQQPCNVLNIQNR